MVCLELLYEFLEEMNNRKVPVLLCGVRDDFATALANLSFDRLLPADNVFREEETPNSSTLHAVRRAYALLGENVCPFCPRRLEREKDRGEWYYSI
jgi:hypothetical protein